MNVSLVRVWTREDVPGGGERVVARWWNGRGASFTLRRTDATETEATETETDAVRPADEHLAAGPGERSPAWLACADVIVRLDGGGAARLDGYGAVTLDGVFARHPGCLVAVVVRPGGECVVGTRAGARARLVPLDGRTRVEADAASYASVVHAWIASGHPLDGLDGARLTVVRHSGAARRGGVRVVVEDGRDGRLTA